MDNSFASRRVTLVLMRLWLAASHPLRQRAGVYQPAFSGVSGLKIHYSLRFLPDRGHHVWNSRGVKDANMGFRSPYDRHSYANVLRQISLYIQEHNGYGIVAAVAAAARPRLGHRKSKGRKTQLRLRTRIRRLGWCRSRPLLGQGMKVRQIFERSVLVCIVLSGLAFQNAFAQAIQIDITPGYSRNSFIPAKTLGAGVDRVTPEATNAIFRRKMVRQILAAGWQTITYRQNTDLSVEAWHWNPSGTWSETGQQGYFVGSSTPTTRWIRHSFGYKLAHSGFTFTEDGGYSRLTDGDTRTFWKSNPYLTRIFTGESDALHPQWVAVGFASPQRINAIHIDWAQPYAKGYVVQYWNGQDAFHLPTKGSWITFPQGKVLDGKGGDSSVMLSATPVTTQYVRVLMWESSGTCDSHNPADVRNCVGYAIRELYIGTSTGNGVFYDAIHHTPDSGQSITICSSVDPWHESTSINRSEDQVGMDLLYRSGLTRGLPAMIPVSIVYGTPENAVAEIAYLKRRGYPISFVELGEEPDGQYISPEDYGALFIEWAAALHRLDPTLKLGGPALEGTNEDVETWSNISGEVSWLKRFLDYLRGHHRFSELSFFSFEHYPFHNCTEDWSDLYKEPNLLRNILQVWRDDGLPSNVPIFITEAGITAGTNEASVDIFAALWWCDFVGSFLTQGGEGVYYFHDLPEPLTFGCGGTSPGTFGMFNVDARLRIIQRTAQFFSSWLINREWVQPGIGKHIVYSATSQVVDPAGNILVTSYALLRPDGRWSLLLINKDQHNAHDIRVVFTDYSSNQEFRFQGPVERATFGSAEYRWQSSGQGGVANPDGPVKHSVVLSTADDQSYTVPKASVMVLKGAISERHR